MLILTIFIVIFLNQLSTVRSNVYLDNYLTETCSSHYECSVYDFGNHMNAVNLIHNKYKNLKILHVVNLDVDQIQINLSSDLRLIVTNSSIWYRRNGEYQDWFEREDIDKIQPKQTAKIERDPEFIRLYGFHNCVFWTTNNTNSSHEINCDSVGTERLFLIDLHIDLQTLSSLFGNAYKKYTYLNLSGKKIENFQGLPHAFAEQILRVNLIDTKINNKPKDFLYIFKNVRQLDLPDKLFYQKPVLLFQNLRKLAIINTPAAIYFRQRTDSYVNRYDRKTRCFTLITADEKTVYENGCLTAEPEQFDWMRKSSLHSTVTDHGREIVAGISIVLFLIVILCMWCGYKVSA